MQFFIFVVIIALWAQLSESFMIAPIRNNVASRSNMDMMWGKKKAPPPPPPAPEPKKGLFSSFSFGKKAPEPEPEPEIEEDKSIFYTARRVTRFMMFPWIFNKYEDTEENPGIRKAIKIKSPPSERYTHNLSLSLSLYICILMCIY